MKSLDILKKQKINVKTEISKVHYKENQLYYCIDDTDKQIIENFNIEVDLFEQIFDMLEKEWFNIQQEKIHNCDTLEIDDDDVCDVCTYSANEGDPLLICQGCSIAVHRNCYGSSFSEDEFFLCQRCIYYDKDTTCIFCHSNDGLVKITNNCKFGHILCVIFDPTVDFDNQNSKEPIFLDNYKRVIDSCVFCNKDFGTKIECSYGLCMNVYHLNCSLDKVYYDIKNQISYCFDHDPTKKRNVFSSNVSINNIYKGYQICKYDISIRKKLKMKKCIQTNYLDILKEKPKISCKIYNELCTFVNKNVLDIICKYWLFKKEKTTRPLISKLIYKNN